MTAAGAPAPLDAKTILVVDDDADFASIVAEVLAGEGYRVRTAANGVVALDLVRDTAFDLILIDIRMPALDGPGFFRALQARDPDLARRVIFMTGDAVGPEVAELLFTLRAPYLRKPLPIGELSAAVRRFFLAGRSFPGSRPPGGPG